MQCPIEKQIARWRVKSTVIDQTNPSQLRLFKKVQPNEIGHIKGFCIDCTLKFRFLTFLATKTKFFWLIFYFAHQNVSLFFSQRVQRAFPQNVVRKVRWPLSFTSFTRRRRWGINNKTIKAVCRGFVVFLNKYAEIKWFNQYKVFFFSRVPP